MTQLVICMGLDNDPSGACLGLRAGTESLEADGICQRYFTSYQQQDIADYIPRNSGPVILCGHSLGGGRIAKAIPDLLQSGGHCESVVMIEPVPCDGIMWADFFYRFDALPVPKQICFYADPPVWGRRYRDEWLNEGIAHPGELLGAHSSICSRARVLNYIADEVRRLAA